MVNALFDTNIYGKIVIDEEVDIIEKIIDSKLVVYNFALIRDELRNTSKKKIFKGGRKIRISLLNAYDQITTRQVIPITKEISSLAESYYREYKRLGGGVSKKKMFNDFKIVACATVKSCDIIVSEDNKTMRGRKALSAYGVVALAHNLRPPAFIGYLELKRGLSAKKL